MRESAADLNTVASYFWSVSNQPLTDAQKVRILDFWMQCLVWASGLSSGREALVGRLGHLAVYLNDIGVREAEWLVQVAAHVHESHDVQGFLEQLLRLVVVNPAAVAMALRTAIEAHQPDFDYQDTIRRLVQELATHDQREAAIRIANMLRHLPGLRDLYSTLTT